MWCVDLTVQSFSFNQYKTLFTWSPLRPMILRISSLRVAINLVNRWSRKWVSSSISNVALCAVLPNWATWVCTLLFNCLICEETAGVLNRWAIYVSLSSMGMCVLFNQLVVPPCKGVIAICFRNTGAHWWYILVLYKFCFNVWFYSI